ncbi:MAG: hypothetical protein AAF518_13455 [Spirochaetota bacterium]
MVQKKEPSKSDVYTQESHGQAKKIAKLLDKEINFCSICLAENGRSFVENPIKHPPKEAMQENGQTGRPIQNHNTEQVKR